jgi:hypothetical protein
MEHEHEKRQDPEELRQILDVVSEKVPKLLNELSDSIPKLLGAIRDTIYSQEAGKNMGKAIAVFYKELKEGGIPDELALKMTKDYAQSLDLSKIMSSKGGININTTKETDNEEK